MNTRRLLFASLGGAMIVWAVAAQFNRWQNPTSPSVEIIDPSLAFTLNGVLALLGLVLLLAAFRRGSKH